MQFLSDPYIHEPLLFFVPFVLFAVLSFIREILSKKAENH
jgi:hypothetical protein